MLVYKTKHFLAFATLTVQILMYIPLREENLLNMTEATLQQATAGPKPLVVDVSHNLQLIATEK